jgi:hypothetical protein
MQEVPTQESTMEKSPEVAPVQRGTLPKATTLIKESITYYKQHFASLIGLAGIYAGVSYGLVFLMMAVAALGGFGLLLFGEGLGTQGSVVALVGGVILFLLLLVAGVWFITWALIALMRSVLSKETPLGVHESFTQAKPLVWPFLVTSFWSGLASCGVVAIAVLLAIVLVAPFIMLNQGVLLIVSFVIACGVVVASLFVANLWFVFAQWLVVDGKAQGRQAVATSKELIKGIFGTALGKYLVISLAYAIPAILVSLICEVAIPLIGPYLSQAISLLVFLPILLVVMARFYQALSTREDTNPANMKSSTRGITILSGIGFISIIVFVVVSIVTLLSLGPEIFSAIEEEYRDGARGPENGAHMLPENTTQLPPGVPNELE